LAAAKTDNEGLYEEAVDEVEDVNYADGYVFPPFLIMRVAE
jgi:hypothetical protein